MKNKLGIWRRLWAGWYSAYSCVVRRACLRKLYGPLELPNLYTHFWKGVERPVQIKDNEYKTGGSWVFECQECGLQMGKGSFRPQEYVDAGFTQRIYGYWIKDHGDNLFWCGTNHSLPYSDCNCREQQIKSILQ